MALSYLVNHCYYRFFFLCFTIFFSVTGHDGANSSPIQTDLIGLISRISFILLISVTPRTMSYSQFSTRLTMNAENILRRAVFPQAVLPLVFYSRIWERCFKCGTHFKFTSKKLLPDFVLENSNNSAQVFKSPFQAETLCWWDLFSPTINISFSKVQNFISKTLQCLQATLRF